MHVHVRFEWTYMCLHVYGCGAVSVVCVRICDVCMCVHACVRVYGCGAVSACACICVMCVDVYVPACMCVM